MSFNLQKMMAALDLSKSNLHDTYVQKQKAEIESLLASTRSTIEENHRRITELCAETLRTQDCSMICEERLVAQQHDLSHIESKIHQLQCQANVFMPEKTQLISQLIPNITQDIDNLIQLRRLKSIEAGANKIKQRALEASSREREGSSGDGWQEIYDIFYSVGSLQRDIPTTLFKPPYHLLFKKIFLDLAKDIASKFPRDMSYHIEKFQIEDQASLMEIARICVPDLCVGIKNFGIQDENARFELAKMCAEHEHSSLSDHIQDFEIHDQIKLIELAKIRAKKNPFNIITKIQNYGIQGQTSLLEIINILVAQQSHGNVRDIIYHFENFAIQNEIDRIQIAKQLMRIAPQDVSFAIKKFRIQDQATLIEIATWCQRYKRDVIACMIKDFSIQDEQARIEIARTSAHQNGKETAEYIKNFQIHDQSVLIELAKICANQNGKSTAKYIQNFEIEDQSARIQIAKIAVRQSKDAEVFDFLDRFDISDIRTIQEMKLLQLFANQDELLSSSHMQDILSLPLSEAEKAFLQHLQKSYIEKAPTQIAEQLQSLLSLFKASMGVIKAHVGVVLPPAFIEAVIQHRNPQQRLIILQTLVDVCLQNAFPCYLEFSQIAGLKYQQYLSPLVALLAHQGVPKERCHDFLRYFTQSLHDDAKQLPIVLDALHLLVEETNISIEDKENLLTLLLQNLQGSVKQRSSELIQRCQIIKILLENVLYEKLRRGYFVTEGNSLNSAISEVFYDLFPFSREIPNFDIRYSQTFSLFRIPSALLTYRSTLQKLNEAEKTDCIEMLNTYVRSVLENNFKTTRYDTSESSHLQALSTFPGLLDRWKEGAQDSLESLIELTSSSDESQDEFDILEFIEEKIDEGHFPIPSDSPLVRYLQKAITKEAAQQGLQSLLTETREVSEQHLIQLQLDSLTLQDAGMSIPEKIARLHDMEAIAEGFEFQNDIAHMIRKVRSTVQSHKSFFGWQVTDSDDPCDLLLAGTEVTGSCQRISGNPNLNKCLLGYLMNGENRILAVKNKKGEIIARRIFRLLINTTTRTPVLFVEKLYTAGGVSQKILRALDVFATRRASAIGLPLLSAKSEENEPYEEGTIECLGGKAPFVYCDGAQGVAPEGKFTIESPALFNSR